MVNQEIQERQWEKMKKWWDLPSVQMLVVATGMHTPCAQMELNNFNRRLMKRNHCDPVPASFSINPTLLHMHSVTTNEKTYKEINQGLRNKYFSKFHLGGCLRYILSAVVKSTNDKITRLWSEVVKVLGCILSWS